jgi:hypothetical protein
LKLGRLKREPSRVYVLSYLPTSERVPPESHKNHANAVGTIAKAWESTYGDAFRQLRAYDVLLLSAETESKGIEPIFAPRGVGIVIEMAYPHL